LLEKIKYWFIWLIYGFKLLFEKKKNISISVLSYGQNVSLQAFSKIHPGSILKDCSIGLATYVAGARIQNADIGAFCSIGPKSRVGGLYQHPTG